MFVQQGRFPRESPDFVRVVRHVLAECRNLRVLEMRQFCGGSGGGHRRGVLLPNEVIPVPDLEVPSMQFFLQSVQGSLLIADRRVSRGGP